MSDETCGRDHHLSRCTVGRRHVLFVRRCLARHAPRAFTTQTRVNNAGTRRQPSPTRSTGRVVLHHNLHAHRTRARMSPANDDVVPDSYPYFWHTKSDLPLQDFLKKVRCTEIVLTHTRLPESSQGLSYTFAVQAIDGAE